MRSFLVTVKSAQDGCEYKSHVEIPDDEWEILIGFADDAEELSTLGVMQERLHVQIKINFDEQSGLRISGTLPHDDIVSALLHRIRPFVLKKEPRNFLRVCGVLAKRISDAHARSIISRHKELFTGKEFQQQLLIVTKTPVLKDTLNSDESFHLWLNAFEYHRDQSKRERLEQLCGVVGFEGARALFVSMLLDKVKAIFNVATIIRHCQRADGCPHIV